MQGHRDPQSKLRCHVQGWMKYVGYFEYCETFNGVYLAATSLVVISKLFQFPLLKDWNCGATLMK